MFRLSVASRALEMAKRADDRKAGIRVQGITCDTQSIRIPVEKIIDDKKVVEQQMRSGGAVTLKLRATGIRRNADALVRLLADLVHGQPTNMHEVTRRDLAAAFVRTKRGVQVAPKIKEGAVHEVHAVIRESIGTIRQRICLTYRDRGLDIEIRSWQPEGFDLTGLKKTGTNPGRMESGFVRDLRHLQTGFEEHGINVQWPTQTRSSGWQSGRPRKT
ncbi:hypothetical protein HYV43_05170 [Candidatus Micrarchaeota archaeon]|nr:hypothetical protein [Candidatus Micrarchaeota archaeon]